MKDMTESTIARHRLTFEELARLTRLREQNPAQTATVTPPLGLGDRVADRLAATVGSWRFIIVQSILLGLWIAINVVGWIRAWDPYPFILLNLALSFQAAYTAPIIMMSQNRQAAIDRHNARATTRSTSRPSWRSNCCTRSSTFCASRKCTSWCSW
ncbi:MAG TPA: DUF1003 domain-containing protein [Stellaceae bacterium]|nr:DUF1003 domain-containing protein [Stellaceae bacterium]